MSSRFTRAQVAAFIPVTGPQSSNGSRASALKMSGRRVAGLDLPSIFACVYLAKARHRSRWRLPRGCSINEIATGTGNSFKRLEFLLIGCRRSQTAGGAGPSHPSQLVLICVSQVLLHYGGRHWLKHDW